MGSKKTACAAHIVLENFYARGICFEGEELPIPFPESQSPLDPGATLDELREAVTTLEDTERRARRVLGGAHPDVGLLELSLRGARATLAARETPGPP